MKAKLSIAALLLLLFSLLLNGCSSVNKDLEAELASKNQQITQLTTEKENLTQENTNLKAQVTNLQANSVFAKALAVVEALKDQDMAALSTFVHPNKGVRFTPYSYVNPQSDLQFTAQQIPALMQNSNTHLWGAFDGSGEPIQLTFNDYFDRFVFDQDYTNAHIIGNNVIIGTGNALNNIAQAYPQGTFIEFHFTGFNPQYEGMDWRSLSLVFEELNNILYLVGIVHSEWTI